MENQLNQLSVSSNSSEADLSYAEHPRFAKKNYKNEGKAAENQRTRREDHMQKHKEYKEDWMNRKRGIESDLYQDEEMEESDPQQINSSEIINSFDQKMNPFDPRSRSKKTYLSRFKNMLMFSDWLVDIPDTLSSEWTMMASPEGRRCLIVGHKDKTNVFHKNGYLGCQFKSALPGGGPTRPGALTILDCICEDRKFKETSKYYVLDLLWWDSRMFTGTEFTIRKFFLRSKLEELNKEENDNEQTKQQFIPLQTCPCLPEAMTEFMKTEFPFELDGLLFYFNSAIYIPEQTPLVGWLKPWMLPEILGVTIPEHLQQYRLSHEFIKDFNKSHGHKSSAQINAEKEKKMQEEEGKKQETKEENKNEGKNINYNEKMDCEENDDLNLAKKAYINENDDI